MPLKITTLDTRSRPGLTEQPPKPSVPHGAQFTDAEFPMSVALKGIDPEKFASVEWLRPKEFAPAPKLFTGSMTGFDVKQGSAGTCWFLSVLAPLGDKPEVIKQIIPDDQMAMDSPQYDGVFHCRFYRNGEWHDVYCDDFLPVRKTPEFPNGRPWAARATNVNEMWVSLVEKAFAKFHGGYDKIHGGWAGNSFVALTGGAAETVPIKELQPQQLFTRVTNALKAECVVACSVPTEKKGYNGLVGGHTYTIIGTTKVDAGKNKAQLLKVRNPWGTETGEWTGAWARSSAEWSKVPEAARTKLLSQIEGVGEFWIELKDYYKVIRDTHICSFSPDLHKDGCSEGLDNVHQIFGEWRGPTAAGSKEKFNCPKYVFKVPDSSSDKSGKLSVIVQFLQIQKNCFDENYIHAKADLYKINDGVLEELTCFTSYYRGLSYLYRYHLTPGEYLLLPSTADPRLDKQFLLRIFSRIKLVVSVMDKLPSMFVKRSPTKFEYNKKIYQLEGPSIHQKLEWIKGVNAGGQPKHPTYYTNPQFKIKFGGPNPIPVVIELTQQSVDALLPIGFKLYHVTKGVTLPLTPELLFSNTGVKTVEGKFVFIRGNVVSGNFLLSPGTYSVLVFTDNPGDERKLILSMSTGKGCSVECKLLDHVPCPTKAPVSKPKGPAGAGGATRKPAGQGATARTVVKVVKKGKPGGMSVAGASNAMQDLINDYGDL